MNNDIKAIKSGVWYTAANFILRSIGFITTPIFTRLLSHEEFGLFNNYTSWLSIFTIIITLNLESTFISARYDFEDKFDQYIYSILNLSTLSGLIWLFFANLFIDSFVNIIGLDKKYIEIMIIYLIFLPAVNMFQTRETYLFQYKMSVLISMLTSISTAVLSVILVLTFNNKLSGRIIGSALPTICVGVITYIVLKRLGGKIDFKYWRYALPICLPYIPHLLSMTVLNTFDRVMITRICGPEDNALYSLAYNCGSVVTLLILSLNTAFSPWLGEKLNDGKYEDTRRVSRKYILLFFVLTIGIMLFAPDILLVLGGQSYIQARYVMLPIMCGCAFQFLYTLFVNVEQFKKKTFGMAFASVSAALLNYILNAIFIPKFGYAAAAYTTLAGYLWLLIIHMLMVKRIGYSEAYSYSFIVKISIAIVIITVLFNFVYLNNPLRYVLVAIYMIIIILLFKKYKNDLSLLFARKAK